MNGNEERWEETKWDKMKRSLIKGNEVGWKNTKWDEMRQKKTIDLLLFAGIEPTGNH